MSRRFASSLFSLICLFLSSAEIATAKNVVISVGGTSTYSDGYGGSYSTAVLQFSPSHVTINAGDTVTFNGLGGAAHNVHADDNSFRCANGCDGDGHGGNGAPSSANWTATVTFNQAGTVNFHCDNHQSMGMVGTITVNAVTAAGPPITGATSGSWYDADESGHGFLIQVAPPNIFIVYWFAYTPDGTQQAWVFGSGTFDATSNTVTVEAAQLDGAKFPPNFVGTDLTETDWGSLTFTFTDCTHGTMSWNSKVAAYGSGQLPITKLLGMDGLTCTQ